LYAVATVSQQVYEALFQTLAKTTDTANEEMFQSLVCEDLREGVAHFLEKRAPRFPGR
jgi:enoyl-CoA hydratase/carnithine racemase